jgi:hypothetical protein
MRFMHADTVLLRSTAAKSAVEGSGLFQKVAESPPFALYRLQEFSSHLAEVVTMPISVRPLKNWMNDSFSWFRTRSKFRSSLPVYGAAKELTAASTATAVREKRLERHYMHFETDAIGAPHLIKVAWHPRWKLRSAGELYLAGPGFMLVVPQGRDIILEFGHTGIGYAGMVATIVSFAIILFLLIRRGKYRNSAHLNPPHPAFGHLSPLGPVGPEGEGNTNELEQNRGKSLPLFLSWAAIALACLWFATQSPEKVYMRGHAALQARHNAEAAEMFQRAFNRRRQPAKKEEALFWLAKATQLAGNKEESLKRYLQLVESYHGYWVPESLYNCVALGRDLGQSAKVESCVVRLKEEYPNSSWTGKLGEFK